MSTILFVDDDSMTRDLIGKLLTRGGYRVIGFGSTDEALQYLESSPLPDLIISDLAMPGRDGFDFLEAVRRSSWGKKLPFIFLTARPSSTNHSRAIRCQADAFIAKPVSSETLYREVSKYAR